MTIYEQLFGKDHIQDGNVIDYAEHGRIGNVSTGQGVKYVQILDVNGTPSASVSDASAANQLLMIAALSTISYIDTSLLSKIPSMVSLSMPVVLPAYQIASLTPQAPLATLSVIGTFFQTTQPVSIASLPALASGSAVIGHVITDIGSVETSTGNVASAATDSGNPVKTGGKYNSSNVTVTNGQRVDTQSTSAGFTRMDLGTALAQAVDSITAYSEGQKATYSASITALAPAITATDIFSLTGSSSKTIRITRVQISGVATAAGAYDIVFLKRSTANSAGTSSAPTAVPHDSSDAGASATVLAYTANPTLGTLVGNMQVKKITVSTAAGAIPIVPTELQFEMRGERAVVLRGTSQVFAINLAATTITGGSLDIDITWTEE